jgi:hypothetical protein
MARRRTTATRVVAGGIVTLLVAATAGAVGSAIAGNDTDPTTSLLPITTLPLDPGGRELAGLLATADGAVYHARYQSVTDESVVFETWHSPPNIRHDTSAPDQGGQVVRSRVLIGSQGQIHCEEAAGGAWQCERVAAGSSVPDPVVGIRDRLPGAEVQGRDDTIDGRPVRCFAIANEVSGGDVDEIDVCVTPDSGIPVRIASDTTELRLVGLDDIVPADTFTPPAPPSG